MKRSAESVEAYMATVPEPFSENMKRLRAMILKVYGDALEETMGYGMLGYVVPKTVYPNGYHCDPNLPLPFINLAAQKHFIALYHMGLYASDEIYQWFVTTYPRYSKHKLDMGKSCIRFKYMDDIPFELIEALLRKMDREMWIALYENQIKDRRAKNVKDKER